MAKFAVKRIFGYGGAQIGRGPMKMWFPVAASQTSMPGDLATLVSGLLSFTKGATSNPAAQIVTFAGIVEERIPTARSSGALALISVGTPGALFEVTARGTGARATHGPGLKKAFCRNTDGLTTAIPTLRVTVHASGVVLVAGIGEQLGAFSTGGFIGKNATSPTAGAANRPYAAVKGISTDTNQRVIFYFPPASSVWD